MILLVLNSKKYLKGNLNIFLKPVTFPAIVVWGPKVGSRVVFIGKLIPGNVTAPLHFSYLDRTCLQKSHSHNGTLDI